MPHVFLGVNAANREGEVVEYFIGLMHPSGMKEKGCGRDGFKPGGIITREDPADKNPDQYYSGLDCHAYGI